MQPKFLILRNKNPQVVTLICSAQYDSSFLIKMREILEKHTFLLTEFLRILANIIFKKIIKYKIFLSHKEIRHMN